MYSPLFFFGFILVVALVNLCLGFATAMLCGRGPSGNLASPAIGRPQAALPPQEPTGGPREASLAIALDQFKSFMMEHEQELSQVDRRLQQEDLTVSIVQQCLDDYMDIGKRYLLRQGEIEDVIPREGDGVGHQIQEAAEKHARQIRYSLEAVERIEVTEDTIEKSRDQLLEENRTVVEDSRFLSQLLAETVDKLTADWPEARLRKSRIDAIQIERPMGAVDRKRIVQYLNELGDLEDQATSANLCIAMCELDQRREFERQRNVHLIARINETLEKIVIEELRDGGAYTRVDNGRVAIVLYDTPLQTGIEWIELIRQRIEKTEIHLGDGIHQCTISCSIVLYIDGDTFDSVYEKSTITIGTASRGGGNRSFLYERNGPEPIAVIDKNVMPQIVRIDEEP